MKPTLHYSVDVQIRLHTDFYSVLIHQAAHARDKLTFRPEV